MSSGTSSDSTQLHCRPASWPESCTLTTPSAGQGRAAGAPGCWWAPRVGSREGVSCRPPQAFPALRPRSCCRPNVGAVSAQTPARGRHSFMHRHAGWEEAYSRRLDVQNNCGVSSPGSIFPHGRGNDLACHTSQKARRALKCTGGGRDARLGRPLTVRWELCGILEKAS